MLVEKYKLYDSDKLFAHGRPVFAKRNETVEQVIENDAKLMMECAFPYDFGNPDYVIYRGKYESSDDASMRDQTIALLKYLKLEDRFFILAFEAICLMQQPLVRFYFMEMSSSCLLDGEQTNYHAIRLWGENTPGKNMILILKPSDKTFHLFFFDMGELFRSEFNTNSDQHIISFDVLELIELINVRAKALGCEPEYLYKFPDELN